MAPVGIEQKDLSTRSPMLYQNATALPGLSCSNALSRCRPCFPACHACPWWRYGSIPVRHDSSWLTVDNEDLLEKGNPVKALYDANDVTGVHLSSKGAEILEDNIQTFFDSGLATESLYETPFSKKRNRSVLSITPPSDKHAPKINKA